MILLAEHDEPTSLAAKKKRQHGASSWPTSTPKNRVWGFENTASGRPVVEPQLTQENATGSVHYTYQIASGRAEWLSRDPMGEGADATLYSYVWNGPVNRIDPLGLAGGGRGSGPSNGSEAITVAADAGLTDFNALQQSAAATANGATFGLAQAIDPTDFTPQPGNEYNQETSALLGFSGTVIVIAALGLSAAPPPPDDDDGGDATPTPKPPPAMPDDMFPPIKYPPPGVTRPAPVPVPSVGPMPGSHSGGC